MKILIVGARGMLGQELAKVFAAHDLHLWDKDELDITNSFLVEEKLVDLHPDIIINSAAYNAVDEAEQRFDLALKINHHGPVNLAKAANKIGATLVHYSSDYVFDGQKKDGYVEHDLPTPISHYGESKYLGEEVREHNPETYLIRTSRLFGKPALSGEAKKSFVEVMLKLADKKNELEIVDEELSNPTYVVDLAVQTKVLVEGNYHPGIYHMTNEGACTWFEFAKEIFQQAGKQISLNPVGGDKFSRPAKRPSFSSLKNTKLPAMRSWQEALTDFVKELDYVEEPKAQKIENINLSNNNSKNMKGIILSGGKGTRLFPLTKITSKQLLPVYNKSMIMYPLQTLIQAGIKDILIIVAPEYAGQYLQLLGSGKEWGIKITYEIQDKPTGLPDAYVIGEKFIGDDNVTMMLGDNLFFDHNFSEDIKSFEKGGRIFAVEVPDPERFGVVEFDENKKVISIEEKPKQPKSNYAVPGIYIFDSRVSDIAKKIKPTWRDETDIVEVHKAYLALNELDVRLVRGRWEDAGTFESLLKASNIAASEDFLQKMGYNKEAVKN